MSNEQPAFNDWYVIIRNKHNGVEFEYKPEHDVSFITDDMWQWHWRCCVQGTKRSNGKDSDNWRTSYVVSLQDSVITTENGSKYVLGRPREAEQLAFLEATVPKMRLVPLT